MCHVIRDNDGKKDFGPRYMARLASLEMHPMDKADRIEDVKDKHDLECVISQGVVQKFALKKFKSLMMLSYLLKKE